MRLCFSTDRLTEDAISIAMATKDNLTHQKNTFGGITSKMNAITCIQIFCTHNIIISDMWRHILYTIEWRLSWKLSGGCLLESPL